MKTKRIVICALFTALTCVATLLIQIKLTPNGYVNVGDCMVIIGGIFTGPLYGAFSAGVGSMLADVISGYYIYAPVTLAVKATMALCACITFRKLSQINNTLALIISSIIAEIVMTLGYFVYEAFLYGIASALASMPGNLLQTGFSIVAAFALYKLLSKNKYIISQIKF